MTGSHKNSKHNFRAFLFHASFLALAQNFMDVDTVMPAMIYESGGSAMHVGMLTAIMLGGSSLTQLFFASYLSGKPFKKKYLLYGINLRVLSLLALGTILFFITLKQSILLLPFIFFFITVFSLSGAYANISYVDLLGKAINTEKRKTFFSSKQIITGLVFIVGAGIAREVLSSSEYPVNYAWSFFLGGGFLLIASIGFWNIREDNPSLKRIKGFKVFMETLRNEWKSNRRLKFFLGFVNTQGVIISLLPFVVYYAKNELDAQPSDTGTFLLFKVIGTVAVSFLVLLAAKRIKYRNMLWLNFLLSILVIATAYFVSDLGSVRYIFIMGGIIFSLYTISMNGLLLEISSADNRAIYTGFVGAGNLVPAIFPLLGAWIIDAYSFQHFLVLFFCIVLSSFFFIYKLKLEY